MVSRTRKHKVDANGRECSNCDTYKPWSEYYSSNTANGKDTVCKDCKKAKQRAYNAKPEVQAAEAERWPERWEAAHPGEEYQRTKIWLVDEDGRECAYDGDGNCGHQYQPWSEFHVKPRSTKGGHRDSRCRSCMNMRSLFARFNITYADVLKLRSAAVFGEGLCDIHGGPETMTYQRHGGTEVRGLSIDHAHDCDQGHVPEKGCRHCIRGLLCCDCNRVIICMAEQWPELAVRFKDYLERRPLLGV